MAIWPACAVFILSMACPLLAQAVSGAELIAAFRAQCLEPFPAIEEIAATARRSGYHETPLKAEDLFGTGSQSLIAQHLAASIIALDARRFTSPAGEEGNPTITAIALERTGMGGGLRIENVCNMSFEKADEGAAGLDVWIAGIAHVLKEKFGFPFKWERKVKRESAERTIGQVEWTPVGFPALGEDRFDLASSLKFIEIEPGENNNDSSTWFLSIVRQEAHP